jgi:5-methylcytosine-specific restriction endonuclease McrA
VRREFTRTIKAAAALRSDRHCESCTALLAAGQYHYDHIIPDAMGGEPTLENCQVVCKACHSIKTGKHDVPQIAKAKRRERARFGIRKRSTFACSRDSKFKKKLDGTVERRLGR